MIERSRFMGLFMIERSRKGFSGFAGLRRAERNRGRNEWFLGVRGFLGLGNDREDDEWFLGVRWFLGLGNDGESGFMG